VCDTDDIDCVQTGTAKSVHDRLGMPDQALVGSIHFKRRSENAVISPFQLADQQPPAIGPLPASVNETVRTHDRED